MRGRALPVLNWGVRNNLGKQRAMCLPALVRGLTQGKGILGTSGLCPRHSLFSLLVPTTILSNTNQ